MSIPDLVRAFAERSLADLGGPPRRVLVEQSGEMRLKPDAAWRPFTAEQWMVSDEVAFRWHARVKLAPLVTAVVDDAFEGGRGSLDVKLWGQLPVAHADGADVDQGEAQRYLAELPWNPAALLRNQALRFESRGPRVVRVWAFEPRCHVDLFFDDAGDIVRTYSETRSRGDAGPEPWEGRFTDYAVIGALRVPRRGEVAWRPEGDRFLYWRGTIESLSYESA